MNGTLVRIDKLYSSVLLPADGTLTSITVVLPDDVLNDGSDYTVTLVSV